MQLHHSTQEAAHPEHSWLANRREAVRLVAPSIRLLGDGDQLLALDVELPISAAIDLLDELLSAGVVLHSVRTSLHGTWARQRIVVSEPDGTPIRSDRRFRLQNCLLPLLERPVSGTADSTAASSTGELVD